VDAALRFGGGYALHAVHAAFIFQFRVDFVALNGSDDFLEAAQGRRRALEDFDFPSQSFRVARIHAEEFGGEESGFVAARSGANFHDDAFLFEGIFREEQELQFALGGFLARGEFLFFLLRHLFHFGVIRLYEHLVRASKILFDLLEFAVLGDNFAQLRLLFGDFLEARRVRHNLRRGKFLRQLVVARAKLVQFFCQCKNGHGSTSRVFS
jgi:hypothetical protein